MIRKRRLELGLFQKAIAARIGVTEDLHKILGEQSDRAPDSLLPQHHRVYRLLSGSRAKISSQKIVQYRHEKGLTQKELGREIGVDGSTVSDWENGHTKPKGKYLKTLLSKIKSGN
jgi:DNA-binding transcriptional regulator YiaG